MVSPDEGPAPIPEPPQPHGVGMPAHLWLEEFGSQLWSAFGEPPYLVGSALTGPKPPRDVDVRMILTDEEWARLGLGDPKHPMLNGRWVALCLAFSALGEKMTGLPIDFQLQQLTEANQTFGDGHPRAALGIVPLRIMGKPSTVEQ